MKLGNNGWGLREMIIYMCILIIILLFVAISIHALYKRVARDNEESKTSDTTIVEPINEEPKVDPVIDLPRDVDYDYYNKMEVALNNATYKYLEDKPYVLNDTILRVDLETLVNLKYIDEIYNDIHSEKCSGFSNVYARDTGDGFVVLSYIRCDNYVTEGY